MNATFHENTFRLLGLKPQFSAMAAAQVVEAERRLGLRLASSVREWYCTESAIENLRRYSNQDCPIALNDFVQKNWKSRRLIPFKNENQFVCTWAILLDGSEDPPVYVDVDSGGTQWNILAQTFSEYIYTCVWDYGFVLEQPALVQAQNDPLSPEAHFHLLEQFNVEPRTHGWPGNTQHRFARDDRAILIWAGDRQADWFVGASDANSLEEVLRTVWDLDGVGESFYDCTEIGKAVLERIRGRG
jgi:hypothetical protein